MVIHRSGASRDALGPVSTRDLAVPWRACQPRWRLGDAAIAASPDNARLALNTLRWPSPVSGAD
ncbi:MAG: hypothetical protein ABIS03_03585 [Gemmatimonadaceae bacterium]